MKSQSIVSNRIASTVRLTGNPGSQDAFSLIELLVVIAIIAVLMAVLLPVAGRIMDNGKRTTCMSNLKQISAAAMAYASDNDGVILENKNDATGVGGDGTFATSGKPNWVTLSLPYLGNSGQVLLCPTTAKTKQSKALGTTYLGSAVVLGRKLASVPRPSSLGL